MAKKLWQIDKDNLNKEVEAFETRDDVLLDQRLVKYDCLGSLAQIKMLRKIKILNDAELKSLDAVLKEIIRLDFAGKFLLKIGDEDVHTKIENYLIKKCGKAGKKIHTGRSRNDQVATAIRLYMKDKIQEIADQIVFLLTAFGNFSNIYGGLAMPGYTHMQKAMPSSISLWIGSFKESLEDDLEIVKSVLKIIDKSPLGSGAGYGISVDLKREYTAKLLGFAREQENNLYCQNSRGKYEALILGAAVSILQTINKFAADVLLFTTNEFGFIKVNADLVSGSSIMPQKKNFDLAELIRSKVHIVLGNYVSVVSLSANLPSGYNRDLQDTKKPLFESLDFVYSSLRMMKKLIDGIKPNEARLKKAMIPELFAAEEAIKLSFKGIPFRQAYKTVAKKFR